MNIQADRAVSFFDLGEDCIGVESSFLTGQEQVFLNDQLISKKRSWRYLSVHSFEMKGQQIEVRFRVVSILRGPVVIELWVDGEMKGSDAWDLKRAMQQGKQPPTYQLINRQPWFTDNSSMGRCWCCGGLYSGFTF